MANGNLGRYLRNTYEKEWKEWGDDPKKEMQELKEEFESEKNLFPENIRDSISKRFQEAEKKANKGEWIDANLEVILAFLTSRAALAGVEFPEKRVERLAKEAYGLADKVMEKVKEKRETPVEDEPRIIKAVAVDILGDFLWAIADGPLNIHSSLFTLVLMDEEGYLKRYVEEIIQYLEETTT